jgi:glycosyltransferase involved in cell wall biosynthesis
VYEHATRLAAHGFACRVEPFFLDRDFEGFYDLGGRDRLRKVRAGAAGLLRRVRQLAGAGRFDLVVVHREIVPRGNRVALRRLRRSGCPVLYDLDDAIWLSPRDHVADGDSSRRRMVRFKDPSEVDGLIRGADRVAAGSPDLVRHARELGAPVDLVPTPVDVERIRPAPRPRRERPLVGWVGSPTAAYCLRAIVPALEEIAGRVPFDLVVVGAGEEIAVRGIRVRTEDWSLDGEAALLASLDVGLYPLPDNPWTRGKCGYKALQYFAAGAAAVVSPVGVNAELAGGGERALPASSLEEWAAALERLLGDAELRSTLAGRARAHVEERYSYEAVTPRLAAAMRGVVRES